MSKLTKKCQTGGSLNNYMNTSMFISHRPLIYVQPGKRATQEIYNRVVPKITINSFSTVPDKILSTIGVDKRTNWKNIKTIYNVIKKSGLNKYQNAAILANIIHESFGNPVQQQIGAPQATAYGFFQNTKERADKMRSIINPADTVAQTNYIIDNLRHGDGKTEWNARGKYKSWIDARNEFNNTNENDPDALSKYVYSLTTGYVGPKDLEGQYKARLETAKKLLKFME